MTYGKETLIADKDGFLCPQFSIPKNEVIGDENCLK